MWLDDEDDGVCDTASAPVELHPIIRMCFIFLLMWQCIFHVSDAGMAILILFVHNLLRLLSSVSPSTFLNSVTENCPSSLYGVRKMLGLVTDQFIKYVVCPQCHSIYEYSQCVQQDAQGIKSSKRCWYIRFPNHPFHSQRQECGTVLLESVQICTGKIVLRPRRVFCYRSLQKSINEMFSKKSFLDLCQKWKQRAVPSDLMGDVYDGNVWKNFRGCDHNKFVEHPFNLMLFLNVDWFQPFTHVQYSVGAIYLTVQNLPRSERYKLDNIILCGIIPGPSEPKYTINPYLSNLVTELNQFWHGVEIVIPHYIFKTVIVKAALTGVL